MPTITLKSTVRRGKLAQVRVLNPDGSHNRAYRITEAEYAALALPGAGRPPGCTQQEWESNLAIAFGQDFEAGDCAVDAGGNLQIKLGELVTANDVEEAVIVIPSGSWSGTPPVVTIDAGVLAGLELNVDRNGNQKPIRVAVTSVVNGVVTWQRL